MVSNSSKAAVLLVVVAAVAVYFFYFGKVTPSTQVLPADESTTIKEEPKWEGKLTTVYLYDGDAFFGGEKKPHSIMFYYFAKISKDVAELPMDENDYFFVFDHYSNKFDVFTDFDTFLGTHSFEPGKVSKKPMQFGEYNKDYYLYVTKNREEVYLLLAAQEFPLQFGKNFSFGGTDTTDDGKIDKEYFYPALEEFGYGEGKKAGTAVFSFDEDGDHKADVKFYVDTATKTAIKPGSRQAYKWQVVFKNRGRWLGYNLKNDGTLKQDSFGSVISRKPKEFYIKMPVRE